MMMMMMPTVLYCTDVIMLLRASLVHFPAKVLYVLQFLVEFVPRTQSGLYPWIPLGDFRSPGPLYRTPS